MSIPALKDSVKIVASDLDGTLLAPNHQLSDFTKLTLKKLHDQGYTFIFATGRHHVDVAGIRQIAGIPAYMITSNGARVHDQNDQLMYSQNVPQELVQPVIDIVRQDPNLFIHMYQNEDWLLDREDEMLAKFHSESGFSYKRFEAENAPSEGIAKVFFTHPEQDHEYLTHVCLPFFTPFPTSSSPFLLYSTFFPLPPPPLLLVLFPSFYDT